MYIYIYREREREREKSVSLQRCIAFSTAALHFCCKGRFAEIMIQRATVPGKWLRPNHVLHIPRPTGSVLSTQEITQHVHFATFGFVFPLFRRMLQNTDKYQL